MNAPKTTEPTSQKYLLMPQTGYSRDSNLTDLTAICRDIVNLDYKLKAQSKSNRYTDYGSKLLKAITDSEKISELCALIGKEREIELIQVEKEARTDKSVRSPLGDEA